MKATSRSPESISGTPIRLDTVDKFIFDGLQSSMLKVFNTPTVWSTSTDKVKALEKLFPNKNAPLVYPYAILSLLSWERAEDRGSLRHASMRGTRISVGNDEKSLLQVRFLPVNFTISLEWYSNSFLNVNDFGRRWLFAAMRGQLNFQVDYGDSNFDIKVVPAYDLTFPKREADPDNIQEYVVETTLIVQGFISEAEPISHPVIDTVLVTAVDGTQPANTINSTFFEFTTPRWSS